jgi:hypothetical protein
MSSFIHPASSAFPGARTTASASAPLLAGLLLLLRPARS